MQLSERAARRAAERVSRDAGARVTSLILVGRRFSTTLAAPQELLPKRVCAADKEAGGRRAEGGEEPGSPRDDALLGGGLLGRGDASLSADAGASPRSVGQGRGW